MADTETSDSDLSSPPASLLSSPLSPALSNPDAPDDMPELYLPPAARAYPSPPASQQTSQSGSPSPDGMDSSAVSDKDGPPPAKRRRISKEPKERTTEYLDMRSGEVDPDQQEELDRVINVLHKRRKIVVIAGAGMSVSAGIPDFRSSTGLFKSLKEEHKLKGATGKHLFDASVYKDDNSTSSFHSMVSSMSRMTKDAKPTAFHHMLATIAKEDRLLRLYSQNVDGIDTSLEPLKTRVPLRKDDDGTWPRTIQLHGGLDKMVCSKCHELSDFDADLFSGPTPPLCMHCEELNNIRTEIQGKRSHGIGRLRPRMVLYNEHNPDDEAIGSVTRDDMRKRPDAVVVVGTTLKVPGVRRIVREMCGIVRDRRDGVTIWINNDLPPVSKDLEDCFDIVVQSSCDEIALRAAMRKWDEVIESDDYNEVSDEDAQNAAANTAWARLPSLPGTSGHDRAHADPISLPSSSHRNNSFSPPAPEATPKKPLNSCDWSPLTSRRSSIIPSVEDSTLEEDNITLAAGLLTPSKSQRPTPSTTVNDALMTAGKLKKALSGKGNKPLATVKTKKSNVKYVKPPISRAKAPAKAKKLQSGPKTKTITSSFTQTKTASVTAKDCAKKSLLSPKKSLSKLRQVSNASAMEPMHPLSPQDARANTLPVKARPSFPGLLSENGSIAYKRKELFA